MRVRTLSTPELGNRSYVVDDGETSVVIDPQRDLDRLEPLLDLDVSHVLETHVHNDYVSGGHELARRTRAAYGVNAADDVAFERLPLHDGEQLRAGSLSVCVLATPGHTPTHLSYVVRDLADPVAPPAVFSGGSLLYGTVGRTDLVSPALTRELAAAQHDSAQRLGALPGDAALFPTHGFGSFCAGGAGSGAESSTIADERRHNAALTTASQVAFVDVLVASFSAYPSYYAHMAPLNRAAAAGVDLTTPLVPATPAQVTSALASGATVVDLRPAEDFAREHLAGTVSVNLGAQFATYVGWVTPWGGPLLVLGARQDEVAEARRQLTRIGVDDVTPAWGPITSLATAGVERRSYRRATFAELAAERAPGDVVVDVRRTDEHAEARVRGSINLPVHEVEERRDELTAGARVWVHCAAGLRAGIAASLLDRHGVDVVHVDDGFECAVELGLTDSSTG
ncbi:MBL fold metallo-hydrolase [Nocardioides sp. 1609]|uniref:MBL fold metallo-hydrolase n=1 Tax=Nocardioides sp. 1609 TaxID=2508327 RepID=UPI00107019EB|nr:MBL fold metallo-hydrolase [Nocardioides sp. 1609]